MHEWAIAENINRQLLEAVEDKGLIRVEKVVLRIGELRQIVPETLKEAFHFLNRETVLAGAELEMEILPLRLRCGACGEVTPDGKFTDRCPRCGKRDFTVISGRELYIDYLEGEKENPE